MRQLDPSVLKESYVFFAKRFYKDHKWIVEQKADQVAQTFLQLLSKQYRLPSLGEEFLWNYLVFQFSYWLELTIQSFDGRMKFTLIFGKKALNRYLERNKEYDWQLSRNRITSAHLHRAFSELFRDEKEERFFDSEDIYRKQFFNQDKGLANCMLTTTLINHQSTWCRRCNFQNDCTEIQRMNYPKVYEQRRSNEKNHT